MAEIESFIKNNIKNIELYDLLSKNKYVFVWFDEFWSEGTFLTERVFNEVIKNYNIELSYARTSIIEFPEYTKKYSIYSTPQFILFRNSKVYKKFFGVDSSDEIINFLNKYIKKNTSVKKPEKIEYEIYDKNKNIKNVFLAQKEKRFKFKSWLHKRVFFLLKK